MFDIGFSELLVVFVVALIILGPERLPTAAKTAGLWIRKIRRSISSVQREINAQLDQEELQQKITQTNQRIMKEGNQIQNMITPLPESALTETNGEQNQQAEAEQPSPAPLAAMETIEASTLKTGTSDSTTTETSRS